MPSYKHLVRTLGGALLFLPATVLAQAAAAGAPAAAGAAASPMTISGTFIDGVQLFAGILIIIMDFLTWFLFRLLDLVMDPSWIFDLNANGTDGSLLQMLREIWQFSRDLVNLGLALLLIVGAIMMIVTADSSKIKEKLPKFVMALVLVNLSWFIPRVIFDVSQVMTYTVYQIPSLLNGDGCTIPDAATGLRKPCEVVTNVLFFPENTQFVGTSGVYLNPAKPQDPLNSSSGWKCPLKPLVCYQSVPFNSPQAQPQMYSKVINGLIINHARLSTLATIGDPRPGGVGPAPACAAGDDPVGCFGQTLSFLVKMIIVLLLHVALLFPMIAMVAAFFLRIPILWVTMAFMPLVAIGFVIGDKMGEFDPVKLFWNQFLSAVFLPLKVAVPFVIGFIMLNAGSASAPPAVFNQITPIAVFTGVSDLWQFLWMCVALFIIWKYSFKVLKEDELMGMFTEKIQGWGKSIGDLAIKAPLAIPWIPNKTAGGAAGAPVSPLEVLQKFNPNRLAGSINTTGRLPTFAQDRQERLTEDQIANVLRKSPVNREINNKVEIVVNNAALIVDRQNALREALEKFKTAHPEHNSRSDLEIARAFVNAFNLDEEKKKELSKILVSRGSPPLPTA